VPVPSSFVDQPSNVYPVLVKTLAVKAVDTPEVIDWVLVDPPLKFASNVTVLTFGVHFA
jgi:hypothetical protein